MMEDYIIQDAIVKGLNPIYIDENGVHYDIKEQDKRIMLADAAELYSLSDPSRTLKKAYVGSLAGRAKQILFGPDLFAFLEARIRTIAGQIKDDENEATAAKNLNDIAMRNAELGLRREEFGMINANRAADNERADAAARTASAEKVRGHMDKLLDRYVPTEGLKDDDLVAAQAKRSRIEQAMLANYGGQMPTDLATFEKNAATMLHQARLTEALNQAGGNLSPTCRTCGQLTRGVFFPLQAWLNNL